VDDHLSDETLSALIDEPGPRPAHLASCAQCEQRLAELRTVVVLLRQLPEVEPPRDFSVGPRLARSSGVARLERWYTFARAAGASLAAVFVLLVGGAAYLDATAPPPAQVAPRAALAPTSPPPPSAALSQRAAAPAPAPAGAGDAQSGSSDQVIATTSARPLPTLTPATFPPVAAISRQAPAGDPGAPLRLAASIIGPLAGLSLLLTLVVRHKLRSSKREG
jgi:hypothetical protein